MKQVLDLYELILAKGRVNGNRTGTDTQRIFGHQMRFNLADGLPVVTTKDVHLKSVIVELIWFLQGRTDVNWLQENGCRIWNEWAVTEEHLDQLTDKPIHEIDRFELYLETITDETTRKAERDRFNSGLGISPAEAKVIFDTAGVPEFYSYRQTGCKVGDLGPVYGKQWRSWACPDGKTIDQIAETINLLKTKPFSRRIIVSAWNPADLPDESVSPQENVLNGKMALAACHTLFQFFADEATVAERLEWMRRNDVDLYEDYSSDVFHSTVAEDLQQWLTDNGIPKLRLSCQLYQRSTDSFLGLPFNIASYALLTEMYAHVCNMIPGDFVWTGGDTHVYVNHFEQIQTQLSRDPKPLPRLKFARKVDSIFDFTLEDIIVEGYNPHPPIKGKVAV